MQVMRPGRSAQAQGRVGSHAACSGAELDAPPPPCRVPLRALLECVAVAAPRYFLETHAQVCGGPDTPPALRCGRRRFQVGPWRRQREACRAFVLVRVTVV